LEYFSHFGDKLAKSFS